jgi:hypothetical protein
MHSNGTFRKFTERHWNRALIQFGMRISLPHQGAAQGAAQSGLVATFLGAERHRPKEGATSWIIRYATFPDPWQSRIFAAAWDKLGSSAMNAVPG